MPSALCLYGDDMVAAPGCISARTLIGVARAVNSPLLADGVSVVATFADRTRGQTAPSATTANFMTAIDA
jgi:hypothetical protein